MILLPCTMLESSWILWPLFSDFAFPFGFGLVITAGITFCEEFKNELFAA